MLQTQFATGKKTAPTPCGADDISSYRAEIALVAGDLTLNNIIEMGPLPANCTAVDLILDSDDLDSNGAPAVTLDVGIMSGGFGNALNDDGSARTIGAEFFAASTVGQAGGVVRPTLKTAFRVASTDVDRGIGIKIAAAPATAQAGTIGLTVIYRG